VVDFGVAVEKSVVVGKLVVVMKKESGRNFSNNYLHPLSGLYLS
jgi:hypothetical protein